MASSSKMCIRDRYKQVAEEFLRTGDMEQAARIFQKILEMDPDNVAMRTKLAEVYIRLGKKTEAWQIFTAAVESLRTRGATAAAEEVVQRMLTLEPGNSQALLLRGRMAFDAGDIPGAIQYLEKVADLDTHADGLRTLQQAYVQAGRLPEARTLADKLLSVHNDIGAIVGLADRLIASGHFEAALQVYQTYADRLLAANQPKVVETLHTLIGHVRGNAAALETLLGLLNKAGESTHLTEVYELLAHAYVQSGELEKARDYYLKLTQLEPQNQLHARNYQQVVERLGGSPASPSLITVEEGATLVDELEMCIRDRTEGDLAAGQHLSDRPFAQAEGMVHADDRSGLGKPVALDDGITQASPESFGVTIERSAAGNKGPKLPPELAPHPPENPPAQQEGLALRPRESLFEFLQSSLVLEIALDFFPQRLQQARHRNQHRDPLAADGANQLRRLQRVLENYRPAQKLRQEDSEELPENVAQGQEIQKTHRMHQAFIFQVFANFCFERRDIGQDIAVRDDHAFGLGRRAGGKDDLEGIARFDCGRRIRRAGMTRQGVRQVFQNDDRESGSDCGVRP